MRSYPSTAAGSPPPELILIRCTAACPNWARAALSFSSDLQGSLPADSRPHKGPEEAGTFSSDKHTITLERLVCPFSMACAGIHDP